MKVFISEKMISPEQLNQWKVNRIKKVLRSFGHQAPLDNNVDLLVNKLSEIKGKYSYNDMYDKWKTQLKMSESVMKLCVALSVGRRKCAQTIILLEGLTAEEASLGLQTLMLKQSEEHDLVNLSACPDHYLLRPIGDCGQEVIETCGNSPFPTQFFITYGDEEGLQTPRDHTYQYQSVGIARTKDGTVIGGVRHQFKDTSSGLEVKLVVEFPSFCPNSLVKAHQMHLACEFSFWLKWIKDNKSSTQYEL